MFRSHFKIALRNFARNKVFSFINIFGLAIGLATCLLIMLYILDESGYDKHHTDAERLFRVATALKENGDTWAADPAPVAAALKNDLPEVEQVTRLLTFPEMQKMLLRYKNNSETKQFYETNGYYADSTFFELFTYDFIYGDAHTSLNQPNSIVISEQVAQKFFGKENPLGKTMLAGTPMGEFNYTVKGVFNAKKYKSHIPSGFFLSMSNNDMGNWVARQTNWATTNIFYTYIKLKQGIDPHSFEQKLKPFFDRHAGPDLKAAGITKILFLQPVRDIYLHSSLGNELGANGNITYLYILGCIAAFILLIACINFMNLSTARSQKRAKEVGVRKVMGAQKSALIWQFLGESFFMCVMALVLALMLAWSFLPLFNTLTQKQLQPFGDMRLVIWIAGVTLVTGLFAGLYPSFYLSAFRPINVLKGKIANNFSAIAIRRGLVVFQFTVSICLVLGAIVIWQQLNFLKDQNLGFNKNQQVILPLPGDDATGNALHINQLLKDELLKNPQVNSVTTGSSYPGIPNINSMLFYAEGKTRNEQVDIHLAAVGDDYLETLGLKLLAGRSFTKEFTADSSSIILNEAAIKQLGYRVNNAVGKKIQYDFSGNHTTLQIAGVVKDFNFESLHNEIKPFGFATTFFANKYSYMIASLKTADYARLLADIRGIWSRVAPNTPFVYSFLDQDFQNNYEKEQRTSSIVSYFTCIAIVIACLGLFGLAAFSAEQRTKEMGVRKVLGATVTDIAALLSKDFIRLVMVAIVIASPLAWYIMHRWLQDFAYRVTISWWIFVSAGLGAIVIALATVSFQAIKAAIANPVTSLRSE